jgi:hypothetical protein
MWRLSQLHGDAGDLELEKETLRTLAKRFPRDEFGQKAVRALDAGLQPSGQAFGGIGMKRDTRC